MLCALLMGGAVCCEQAAAAAGMERDGYAGTEKAGEGQDSYNVTDWQDSIPLDEVESAFRSMQGKESSFSIKEYVEDIIKSNYQEYGGTCLLLIGRDLE